MIDNYVDSVESLVLYVYAGGSRVSADATPTVSAIDSDTEQAVTMAAVTTTAHPDGYDYYSTSIDPSEVTSARQIIVTWSYVYDGQNYTRTEIVNVVRPYFDIAEIWARFPQFASGGAEAQTYDELQLIERRVRYIIDNYCNQSFQDFGLQTKRVRGNGNNFLQLPHRIYRLESVKTGELVLFERDGDGVVTTEIVNWFEDEPHVISKTGSGTPFVSLRDKDPFLEIVDRTNAIFRSSKLYEIEANYGWKYLPQQVSEAAVLLAYEQLQMDDRYRTKNIVTVRSADYRMEFGADHHTTTGNVDADHMLTDFVRNGVYVF